MDAPQDGPPVIGLPERIDRRMRMGPFASSRDALKFVLYAATAALLAPFTTPWIWLPLVAGGFAVSVWRPEGQAVDERAITFVQWKIRCWNPRGSADRMTGTPLVRQGLIQLNPHHYAAVVRTGGTPVAYLPPDELGRRFELYRELLRSMDTGFVWLAATVPIRAQAVRPNSLPGSPGELRAASGYSELVTLLCRRRLLRRIYIVIGTHDPSPDAIGRLEGRIAHLLEGLGALGLRPIRLRDRSLAEAARRFGWPVEVRGT
jgi:hypothetical protein